MTKPTLEQQTRPLTKLQITWQYLPFLNDKIIKSEIQFLKTCVHSDDGIKASKTYVIRNTIFKTCVHSDDGIKES